jgi:hypothetical protein
MSISGAENFGYAGPYEIPDELVKRYCDAADALEAAEDEIKALKAVQDKIWMVNYGKKPTGR